MHVWVAHLARFFLSLSGVGLILLGTLDSSFLFVPLGNDLLLVLLTVRHHDRVVIYALCATLGSVIGCFITDWISRKGGEAGLKGRVSARRLAYVQKQVSRRAGVMLAVAALAPPPFPFTVFVIVAAALQVPRWRLLGVIAAARLARFLIEGALAVRYGRQILRMAQTAAVQDAVIGLMAISIAGSAWSIYSAIRRSKSARRAS